MLAIYVPRMRNNNLKIMNAGSSSRPQLHCGQSLAFLLKQICIVHKTLAVKHAKREWPRKGKTESMLVV